MESIELKFKDRTAAELEEAIQPAIDKYDLSAEYEDGKVRIYGPPHILSTIFHAYSVQFIRAKMREFVQ